MKNITTIIAAFLFVGITSVNAQSNTQVKFNNSNDGDPIGEISVTPDAIGELNGANIINIYSYGRTIFVKTDQLSTVSKNISVYNVTGQLVFNEDNVVGGSYSINLASDLMKGVYLVKVETGDDSYTRKVFVR